MFRKRIMLSCFIGVIYNCAFCRVGGIKSPSDNLLSHVIFFRIYFCRSYVISQYNLVCTLDICSVKKIKIRYSIKIVMCLFYFHLNYVGMSLCRQRTSTPVIRSVDQHNIMTRTSTSVIRSIDQHNVMTRGDSLRAVCRLPLARSESGNLYRFGGKSSPRSCIDRYVGTT